MSTKHKLFIDANIFLGFYNSNQPEFKKLLLVLCELSQQIIVTQQIVDEVQRNKLEVFRTSVANYINQANIKKTLLPEHLTNPDKPILTDWNKKRNKLEKDANELENDLIKGLSETMHSVSASSDRVSTELKRIFSNLISVTDKQLADARHRKEIGNPPGKPNDPLGDQLSWAQLLDQIKDIQVLYIITNDADYFTEFNKQLYLNSYLYNELKSISPKLEIKVFNKLSEGLAEYNKHKEIISLPDKKELERITTEEPEFYVKYSPFKFQEHVDGVSTVCPSCNSSNSFFLSGYTENNLTKESKSIYRCIYCGACRSDKN